MQEIIDLRQSILEGRTSDALALLDELEAMGRKSVIYTIESYLVRLVMHLIKADVERRMTNSWRHSIRDSAMQIKALNVMDNKRSPYIHAEEWASYIDEAFIQALSAASVEIADGKYSPEELERLMHRDRINAWSLDIMQQTHTRSKAALAAWVDEKLLSLE
jgi:hypothetical protein